MRRITKMAATADEDHNFQRRNLPLNRLQHICLPLKYNTALQKVGWVADFLLNFKARQIKLYVADPWQPSSSRVERTAKDCLAAAWPRPSERLSHEGPNQQATVPPKPFPLTKARRTWQVGKGPSDCTLFIYLAWCARPVKNCRSVIIHGLG